MHKILRRYEVIVKKALQRFFKVVRGLWEGSLKQSETSLTDIIGICISPVEGKTQHTSLYAE